LSQTKTAAYADARTPETLVAWPGKGFFQELEVTVTNPVTDSAGDVPSDWNTETSSVQLEPVRGFEQRSNLEYEMAAAMVTAASKLRIGQFEVESAREHTRCPGSSISTCCLSLIN